jgi:hypothetical protein
MAAERASNQSEKKLPGESWGSHVDRMIREAQARGDFDNIPGTGKPLQLEDDNPFNPEWSSAFRVAKNAGAAPLWVELDKEIGAGRDDLNALLERTAIYLDTEAARIRRRQVAPKVPDAAVGQRAPAAGRRRWWPFGRAAQEKAAPEPESLVAPQTLGALEAERRRVRGLYLAQAAELDAKIQDFNQHRPRNLTWIEKPRLLPEEAGRRFDERCPETNLDARNQPPMNADGRR